MLETAFDRWLVQPVITPVGNYAQNLFEAAARGDLTEVMQQITNVTQWFDPTPISDLVNAAADFRKGNYGAGLFSEAKAFVPFVGGSSAKSGANAMGELAEAGGKLAKGMTELGVMTRTEVRALEEGMRVNPKCLLTDDGCFVFETPVLCGYETEVFAWSGTDAMGDRDSSPDASLWFVAAASGGLLLLATPRRRRRRAKLVRRAVTRRRGGLAKLLMQRTRGIASPQSVAMLSVSEDTAVVVKHHVTAPEPPVVIPEHPAYPVDHSSTTAQNDSRSDQPAVPTAAMPLISRLSPTLCEFARPLSYAGRGAAAVVGRGGPESGSDSSLGSVAAGQTDSDAPPDSFPCGAAS
ncbi:MAG: hypothetical protein ACK5UC_15385, partial [Planctomycetaceae bacterium]